MNLQEKKLLILGANPETAGLVRKANELGIYTIVTDYNPNAYAKQYASKAIDIDATDLDSLVNFAREEGIDGVLVGVAEALLPTYQKLCEKLGFPYYAELDLLDLMTNKQKFKDVCRKYDVPVVDEYVVDSFDKETLKKVKLPVVVKPVDSCSSKGISVCHSLDELQEGIKKALGYSSSKNILIEKYMTGDEVIVYYVFQNGKPIFVAMCDRYTNKEQEGVAQLPTAYIYPSRHLKRYQRTVDDKVKNMFENLKIKQGVIFIQSFIDENGEIRFYEPGFRLNGAQEHYLVDATTGIDAKELMINFSLTGTMSESDISINAAPNFNNKYCCKLSPLVKLGRIGRIEGLDIIENMPEVVSINPSYQNGDIVSGYGTLKQIVCRFFVVADTKAELIEVLNNINSVFEVYDENNESMLLSKFDPNVINDLY